ncbi:MAG TPA: pyridoxamine 5'-phosphate oxidase family protein [Candidatus Limnocylindrales bacterium]|nr:pyridoxamine 5'-phosphate oxidase family protein [Candidatus Limnocylindrales bacterium]
MDWLPTEVRELLEAALVAELTVVNERGSPVTYPLIPLYDDGRIYMTSSVLFSKKLEHLKRDAHVCVSVTDPVATGGRSDRATIQGEARVLEDDPHTTWERVLPIWRAKEPAIDLFYKQRFGLPLFFERSLIEIIPRRALYWADGGSQSAPSVSVAPEIPPEAG